MGCECEHSSDIAKLKDAVFGNGKPERSLITRAMLQDERSGRIERRIGRIEKIGWGIIAMLMLAVAQQYIDMIRVQPVINAPAAVNTATAP